jgi:hypothetical protein
MKLTGNCFCGAVKYELLEKPFDARSCHCSMCRKAFSAQASAYALVKASAFRWVTGEDNLTAYVGEHGAGYRFCKICGSTLCGVVDNQVHGITLGCLNEDPKIKLSYHLFVGSKASWEQIADGVPQHEQFPPSE